MIWTYVCNKWMGWAKLYYWNKAPGSYHTEWINDAFPPFTFFETRSESNPRLSIWS